MITLFLSFLEGAIIEAFLEKHFCNPIQHILISLYDTYVSLTFLSYVYLEIGINPVNRRESTPWCCPRSMNYKKPLEELL